MLEEFDITTKTVLNKFISDVKINTASLGIDSNFAKSLTTPIQIMNKEVKKNMQNIVFKNKFGQKISISVVNDIETIKFLPN